MLAHVGTHQHMSISQNVLTHASMQDKVKMIGIRCGDSGFTCWHVPAQVDICRHISAHVGMSTHASIQIRSKQLLPEVSKLMSHVGACQRMPVHISTCRHVQMC